MLVVKLLVSLLFVVCVVCETVLTPAVPCPGDTMAVDEIQQRITVSPCGKKSCRLERNTNITVTFRFKPKQTIKTLKNKVYASISVLQLPFIGVDGQDACTNIVTADGEPAPCPLTPNQEYIYTNTFFIQPFYPAVSLRVHWSLNQGDSRILCFEVPARIVAAKKSRQ